MIEMNDLDLFEWQVRQAAVWERWWRERRRVLKQRPGDRSREWHGAFLANLLKELEQQTACSSRQLADTLFDPDLRFLKKSARVTVKRKSQLEDWLLLCEQQVQLDKWSMVQTRIQASVESGCELHEISRAVIEDLLGFEMCCVPVYLYTTLQVMGPLRNEAAMLTGLACAQIDRGDRARLNNALTWLSSFASPSNAQLRRVLRTEALKVIWDLPFITLGEIENRKQQRLNEILSTDPDRFSDLQIERLSRRIDLTPAGSKQPTLDFSEETIEALIDLPNIVSNAIIKQAETMDQNGAPRTKSETDYQQQDDDRHESFLVTRASQELGLEEQFLQKEKINTALKSLSPKQQVIAKLVAEGYNYREIATRANTTEASVEKELYRLRQRAKIDYEK